MRTVDVVLFDKTGTLTKGEHSVTGITAVDADDDRVLGLAAAVESDSEHPLARAIVAAAQDRGTVPIASGFTSMSGRGVEATVGGTRIAIGGPALVAERDLDTGPVDQATSSWKERGAAVLYVIADRTVIGALALEDEIRQESMQAVEHLHQLGIRVAMITGDAQQVADAIAADLDIDEVHAQVLPEDKHSKVAELQQRGDRVAMVGDGVNDAPALAQADVGIAIGAGTDVAIESAGIVLASDDPRGVVAARRLSGAGYRKMIQNLIWAAGYNVLAIPLAAGALAWAGVALPPAAAAVLMSASTVIVALNALLLRRVELAPTPGTTSTA
jgi:Cu2+-exporting ATPase